MGILSKNEYDNLTGLWMKNHKKYDRCNDKWDAVLRAHEPLTEFLELSYKDRMKSLETSHPEDKDKFITFK